MEGEDVMIGNFLRSSDVWYQEIIILNYIVIIVLLHSMFFEYRSWLEKHYMRLPIFLLWNICALYLMRNLRMSQWGVNTAYDIKGFLIPITITSIGITLILFNANVIGNVLLTLLTISSFYVLTIGAGVLQARLGFYEDMYRDQFVNLTSIALGSLVCDVIVVLIYILISVVRKKKLICSIGTWISLLLVILSILFIQLFVLSRVDLSSYDGLDDEAFVIVAVEPLVLALVFFLMIYQMTIKQERILQTEREKSARDNELKNYRMVEEEYKKQQARVHEYRNEIRYISDLLQNKEYTRIQDYLEELIVLSNEHDRIIETGNVVVNSILNRLYSEGTKEGITFQFIIGDLSGLKLPDESLVVILSNISNNILECERDEDDKEVKVVLEHQDNGLTINVKNRVSGKVITEFS